MNPRFACLTCNAPLEHDGRSATARCDYCGTVAIVPDAMRSTPTAATPHQPAPSQTPPLTPAQAEAAQHKQAAINDIMELVRAGRQGEASQLYHQTFGVSLKEAKRTVAQLVAEHQGGGESSLSRRLGGFLGGLFGSKE